MCGRAGRPGCGDQVEVGNFDPEKQIPSEHTQYSLAIEKAWQGSQMKYICQCKYVCSSGGRPGS